MSFNDLLSQLTPNSVKGEIIDILSENSFASAKQIYSKVKINKAVSYQAVHKSLTELEQTHVIKKDNKKYYINQEWADNLIKKLNKIKSKKRTLEEISINKNSSGPQIFKFTSYSKLCVSIAELLKSRVLINNKNSIFICTLEYGWFPFKFKFGDFLTLGEMMKANPDAINIVRTKTPLGGWLIKQYKKINAICAPIGTKVDIDTDLFIYCDYILEVHFSKESKDIINYYYNKTKNLNGIYREFALKKEPEMDITLTITKNPALAKLLGKQLKTIYENAIKEEKKI